LKTSTGDEVSYGNVKVVKEFKADYYIMHISDGHIYQSGYDPITLLARKSAMIDIANIMDCQIIIETGDNMYNVRNHPEREVDYFLGIESEGIKGMAKARAATFLGSW
jgi:predicted MPP superfamily phosphohydrolase